MKQSAVLHEHFLKRSLKLLSPEPALSVRESLAMHEAVRQMATTNIGCMVVTDSTGNLRGILTERDVLMKLSPTDKEQWRRPVSEFMTPHPRTLRPSASVARVLYEMATGKFRHIPIISSKQDDPIRIISVRDFLDYIHRSVTGKMIEEAATQVVKDGSFHEFFHSRIDLLQPKKPEVVRDIITIGDAVERMKSVPIGAIVVLGEDQRICGIFSERDYLRRVAVRDEVSLDASVLSVSSTNVVSALNTASVALVFDLMAEGNYRHMPIVDTDEDLVGVLSLRNFVDFLSHSILEELENYENIGDPRK